MTRKVFRKLAAHWERGAPEKHVSTLLVDPRFVIVHHRKLNSRKGLEEALAAQKALPQYTHVVEGDLCWAELRERTVLYLHHPNRVYDSLKPTQIAKAADAGKLWTLEQALDERYSSLGFVVELKTGRGPRHHAIRKAVDMLQAKRPGRFWFATFSVRDTEHIRLLDPTVSTCLHTEVLTGKRVLETSPMPLGLSYRNLATLPSVDILALNSKAAYQHLLPPAFEALARTARRVREVDKALLCVGVTSPDRFREIRDAGVQGAYIRFPWRELEEGAGTLPPLPPLPGLPGLPAHPKHPGKAHHR